ncbi:hypothetical protein JIY74_29485 [Vibrio harveyi]|nr:hypothetical protein [Vibrio harveyi]
MRNKKIPIYNYEKTVCKEIGYFKNRNNEIQIKPLPKTIKKVPEVLPNNITSLKGAFEGNISKIIENLDK